MTKKSSQQPKEVIEIKQEDSNFQKISSFLRMLFLGDSNIEKQINRAIVSNTYYQILEIIRTVLLFTVYKATNNSYYSLVQSVMGGFLFLVCLIPRISKRHLIFQINFILYLLGTVGSGLAMIILFENFFTFEFYCSEIQKYYKKKSLLYYDSKQICSKVYQMYLIEAICEIVVLVLRLVYLAMCIRAYMIAKQKYQEEQKKKEEEIDIMSY